MSKAIKPQNLGKAIAQELSLYHEKINENCYAAGLGAVKSLVKKTKATAPVAKRTGGGSFKKNIAWKELEKSYRGYRFVWYVKPPDHRLTHLLVKGHATRNGGRTTPNPFLQNALDTVLPDYERDVEEAIKND